MNGNLECQLERRFRPLNVPRMRGMSIPPKGRSINRYEVSRTLTAHDCDVFCLQDGLDYSLPVVRRLGSWA